MKVRTSVVAAGAAVVLGTIGALLVPAVASASSTVAAAKFSGCLVTNTQGIHKSFNKVAWQGMQAAAAAEPSKIQVRFLVSQTASAYAPNIDTFIVEKCGLIVTVGPSSAMAQVTELAAKDNPAVKFAIVDCSYASGCLASPKLKNLVSVKGTASAVKTLVLARANGT
jgi:basic membrane protein A and related proteins